MNDPVSGRLLALAFVHERLFGAEELHGELVIGWLEQRLQLVPHERSLDLLARCQGGTPATTHDSAARRRSAEAQAGRHLLLRRAIQRISLVMLPPRTATALLILKSRSSLKSENNGISVNPP